jgi:hypothetical protein
MTRNGTASTLPKELRSWVDNCLVPILMKEYLREAKKMLAPGGERVSHSAGEVTSRAEVNQ